MRKVGEALSMATIRSIFQNLNTLKGGSLQLLKINFSSRTGTGYNSRRITLVPDKRLDELLDEIADIYLGNGKKRLIRIGKFGNTTVRRMHLPYIHLISPIH